jgi:hypothetical protein
MKTWKNVFKKSAYIVSEYSSKNQYAKICKNIFEVFSTLSANDGTFLQVRNFIQNTKEKLQENLADHTE